MSTDLGPTCVDLGKKTTKIRRLVDEGHDVDGGCAILIFILLWRFRREWGWELALNCWGILAGEIETEVPLLLRLSHLLSERSSVECSFVCLVDIFAVRSSSSVCPLQ